MSELVLYDTIPPLILPVSIKASFNAIIFKKLTNHLNLSSVKTFGNSKKRNTDIPSRLLIQSHLWKH